MARGTHWCGAEEEGDDEFDDLEIDVCQHCGRFYSWTPAHNEAAEKAGGPGWNPQRCMRCITDECWIERDTP